MSRLTIPEAQVLSHPSITAKGFWEPTHTTTPPLSLCSVIHSYPSCHATLISGGDGTVFDSSAFIRIQYNVTPAIDDQFRQNVCWGGLPKHILDNVSSLVYAFLKQTLSYIITTDTGRNLH